MILERQYIQLESKYTRPENTQNIQGDKKGDITQQDIKETGFEVMTGARDMILNGFGKSLIEGKRRDR